MSVKPYIQRMVEAGEARVDRLIGQILSNERFVSAVQGIVSRSLAAKGSLDKSLRSALNTMNLPSTADIEELRQRLDDLDRSLAELSVEVSRLGPAVIAAGAKTVGAAAKASAQTKKAPAKKPASTAKPPRSSTTRASAKAKTDATKKTPARTSRKAKPEPKA